jgi:hypothetical protein
VEEVAVVVPAVADVDASPVLLAPPLEPPDDPDPASSAGLDARDRPADAVAERSFLAQPEPLKWTAGAAKPLRIVPSAPQLGQNLGPPSRMPWMTSVRWPQAAQV